MEILQDIIHSFDYYSLLSLFERHTPQWDKIWTFITSLGNFGALWLVIAALLLIFRRTRRCGFAMLIALGIGVLIGNLGLKNLVHRPRPFITHPDLKALVQPSDEWSFPSGHALSSFAAATALFCHYRIPGLLCYVPALAIAFSRLYCCVHYPTDVLCGALLGIFCGIIAAFITEHLINGVNYIRLKLT